MTKPTAEHALPDPPRLTDVSDQIAHELWRGLRDQGERELAHAVFSLRVWGTCSCGTCGSFRTRPKLRKRKQPPAVGTDPSTETAPTEQASSLPLSTLPGYTSVDVTIEEPHHIVFVEILDRPDVADELHRGLIAARSHG